MRRKNKLQLVKIGEFLTEREETILRRQIRRNSRVIDSLVEKIDLLANRERCPKDANTLLRLRKQLSIEVEENDNFRKVLWRHLKAKESWRKLPDDLPDPITFLVDRIKTRRQTLIAQTCLK